MKTFFKYLTILVLPLFIASCSDDDDGTPEVINEEEVITTMTITLAQQTGGTPITLTSRDADGEGPNPPVETIMGGPLMANTTYSGTVVFLNETETPPENVTEEVEEEDEEHQIFYQVNSGLDATISYDDMDDNGNPVGLEFTLTTGAASTGNLTVVLIHEPEKDATGVANGDRTNAGGEEDFTATFLDVTIQ
ncbi:MAG: type 1 periplasmic binding fold superfamily protein [Leeuwenhoekiella sp.]